MYLCGRMLKSVLQTVCQSLSDSSQVVRSAGLFALGQFSEHLQVSQDTPQWEKLFFCLFFCLYFLKSGSLGFIPGMKCLHVLFYL